MTSAIARNKTTKKGHHKNRRPMGKICIKEFFIKHFVPKLRLFPVYTVPKIGHFVTSVSLCKQLKISLCPLSLRGLYVSLYGY